MLNLPPKKSSAELKEIRDRHAKIYKPRKKKPAQQQLEAPEAQLVKETHNTNVNRSNLILKRIAAYLVDLVTMAPLLFIVAFIMGMIIKPSGIKDLNLMSPIISTLTFWIYMATMESSRWQATIGKKILGLKVINTDGEKITFSQGTGRFFAKFISAILLLFGYIMILWNKDVQTLHDKLASCLIREIKP